MSVKVKKFYVTEKCVSCGKCTNVCPLGNVQLKDGKPEWDSRCRYCMVCMNRCPVKAIEYGVI